MKALSRRRGGQEKRRSEGPAWLVDWGQIEALGAFSCLMTFLRMSSNYSEAGGEDVGWGVLGFSDVRSGVDEAAT